MKQQDSRLVSQLREISQVKYQKWAGSAIPPWGLVVGGERGGLSWAPGRWGRGTQRKAEKRGPGSLATDLPALLRTCIHSCPQVCERSWFLSFFLKNNSFTLFMAVMGLPCCMWASSSCSEWWLLFIAEDELLIEMASLVSEQGLRVQGLQ